MAGDAAAADGAAAVTFVGAVALLLGVVTLKLQMWLPLPYTALLLIWGLVLGICNETFTSGWGVYGEGVTSWRNIPPHFILSVLLPGILFGATFAMPKAVLRRSFPHILLLGVLGVLMGIVLTAVFARYVLPYDWTWHECLLFGSVLSATDPVAVVAVLKELRVPDELTVVVDGEALVDDGVAAVMYIVCTGLVQGNGTTAGAIVRTLCRQSLAGPAIGLAFGLLLVFGIDYWPADGYITELGLTLAASFGAFTLAEDVLQSNGILCVVTCGFVYALLAKREESAAKALESFWSSLEWCLNTLLFVLIGVVVAGRTYEGHDVLPGNDNIDLSDYGFAVLLWLALLVVRTIDVALLWPLLAHTGHGFSIKGALVTIWSGLRGVVGVALALLVFLDPAISNEGYKLRVLFFMGSTVCLTVLVQGSLITPLLKVLQLVDTTGSFPGAQTPSDESGRSVTRSTELTAITLQPKQELR
ncbi:Na+/H+ antiporter [Klebsormidium nitens]|uniref:Na+/H+ antiporter n=1 Tax=Klebsormidium nitens TaxID=105231 RepID=A0A1Y1HNL5_KLENI|nr:Na+/H+ antiporter [Klebsormidium nitens]|eukprot:GAQ79623.1 Na+/H+ antiporter [Klebsormidium nitens]